MVTVRQAAVVALALAGALAIAVRLPGGPLDRPSSNAGVALPAGLLPVGVPIYLTAPPPRGGVAAIIERIVVKGASPGVRVVRVFVVQEPRSPLPDVGFWFGKPADGGLIEPPAFISLRNCCEPQEAFAIEFQVEDLGPHSIDGLDIDYRAGLFAYRTSLPLFDWGSRQLIPTS